MFFSICDFRGQGDTVRGIFLQFLRLFYTCFQTNKQCLLVLLSQCCVCIVNYLTEDNLNIFNHDTDETKKHQKMCKHLKKKTLVEIFIITGPELCSEQNN